MTPRFRFPDGQRFAFTVIDDTDVSTVENIAPVYGLLERLGLRTTKTVWPLSTSVADSNFAGSESLEDPAYLDFVLDLKRRGFEITWHSPAMESSERREIELGMERFRELIGHYPRIHASHAENRENPYWGHRRVDIASLRWMLRRMSAFPEDHFLGDVEGSRYWWGDLAERHIQYARNLTFETTNLARVNPSMPYRDPHRPMMARWFSASDGPDVRAFCRLLEPSGQDRLEREGGFCIVATHFGKGFAPDGALDPEFVGTMERLAERPGWFPTVGELLDWLLEQRDSEDLPRWEWTRMQLRWFLEGFLRHGRWRWEHRRFLTTRRS
jgi:hypothetical protein